MYYTVMEGTANVALCLEGLTKTYRVPMLIAQSVAKHVNPTVPCRLVDAVTVKGKDLRLNHPPRPKAGTAPLSISEK